MNFSITKTQKLPIYNISNTSNGKKVLLLGQGFPKATEIRITQKKLGTSSRIPNGNITFNINYLAIL